MTAAEFRPTVAVVTALACELAAVKAVLHDSRAVPEAPAGDPNQYWIGELPSRAPDRPHRLISTVLPQDGTRMAATVTTDLLRSFPSVRCVVFCGIAGAVPLGRQGRSSIALGDVLVAVDGIVDYDHTASVDGRTRLRRHLQGLSMDLSGAVAELRAASADAGELLAAELTRITAPEFARPVAGPSAAPGVHFGAIGSADRLLRDAVLRDALAVEHGILGFEMEASGLAISSSRRAVPWFVVRGVADHCDGNKSDLWHRYASLTAAAFTAVLLRHCRPLDPVGPLTPSAPQSRVPRARKPDEAELAELVRLLAAIPAWLDPAIRQAVIEDLGPIAGVIQRPGPPQLEARIVIRTCWDYPDGPERLVTALVGLLGAAESVTTFRTAAEKLRGTTSDHWGVE